MKKKLTIRFVLISILILLFVFRWGMVLDSFVLLFFLLRLFFRDYAVAVGQISLDLFDYLLSSFLIIIIPAVLIFRKNKFPMLHERISFTTFTIIVLLVVYVFAPLITTSNPEFQKNISVTKLLPPFSSVNEIYLSTKADNSEPYFKLKDKVIRSSFNDHVLFADSIKTDSNLKYYQKGQQYSLSILGTSYPVEDYKVTRKHFIMGTDEFGRDIFSRLIYGARISLSIGVLSVLLTLVLGSFLGFFAGFSGGLIDSMLNRLSDMLLSFPLIFLIILIISLFGNSVISIIMVLGFSGWMSLFKIVRGEIIAMKGKDYFLTAKLLGVNNFNLIFSEMLPVISASVIVNLIFQFGNVILAESALSYLGLGAGGIYPSWGSMIESGQSYIAHAWWMILFPGLALFFTLFMTNNLGNKIKIVSNPGLKN